VQLLVESNASWRWLVNTRPWIIPIRSWGTITTRSLYDFTQHSETGRHKLWKQCWKDHRLCTPATRHVYLCSYKFVQKNHTTTSLVRSSNNIPVITSQNHWYEKLHIRVIAFSHHLQDVMGVVVLETTISVLYALTPCREMCARNSKNLSVREWSTDLSSFYNTQQWGWVGGGTSFLPTFVLVQECIPHNSTVTMTTSSAQCLLLDVRQWSVSPWQGLPVLNVVLGVGGTVIVSESHGRPTHSCDGWVCVLGSVVTSSIFGWVRGAGARQWPGIGEWTWICRDWNEVKIGFLDFLVLSDLV
jgi:hypothetical protein